MSYFLLARHYEVQIQGLFAQIILILLIKVQSVFFYLVNYIIVIIILTSKCLNLFYQRNRVTSHPRGKCVCFESS